MIGSFSEKFMYSSKPFLVYNIDDNKYLLIWYIFVTEHNLQGTRGECLPIELEKWQ